MTDGADLLAAILANPDDDNVRLVYADWLQEHGEDARAEFIRVQIKSASIPDEPPVCHPPLRDGRPDRDHAAFCDFCLWKRDYSDARIALSRREDQLHGSEAAMTWRPLPWGMSSRTWWRRGFLDRVTCTAADWLAHADAILAAHPVRKVTLTTPVVISTALAAHPVRKVTLTTPVVISTATGSDGHPAGSLLIGAISADGSTVVRRARRAEYVTLPTTFTGRDIVARNLGILHAEWLGVEFDLPP